MGKWDMRHETREYCQTADREFVAYGRKASGLALNREERRALARLERKAEVKKGRK